VRLKAALTEKNALIERVHGAEPLALEEEVLRYAAIGARLAPHVGDTGAELRAAWKAGKRLLFEGAQGVMLDIDHGTYPYVTSSNTGTGGIATGSGFPPQQLEHACGIAKAYCTRVGEGPFPSELHGELGDRLRIAGNEFGATTGRPRRCGWFDAVAVKYALELNGADRWVLTNLDVLTGFHPVRVGIAYRVPGLTGELVRTTEYPAHLGLERVEVEYEEHAGWDEDLSEVRRFADLPAKAREYVERLEELVGVRTQLVSIGPDREQVIPR
jgi:adenylosuccinate synthase